MKILYICNQRLPTEKAYGIQVSKMCEAFADLGHEVTLFVPTRHNPIKDNIFHYYNVRRNFKLKRVRALDFYLPGRLDRLAFEIKMFLSALILSWTAWRGQYDIIYSRDEWPLWFLSFCRENIFFEAHKFSNHKKFIYKRLKRKKLIVITEGLQQEFHQVGFEDILVASDGVDLEEFSLKISKEEARKRTSLPLDKKIIMYTGHLYDWKGVDTVLKMMKDLRREYLLVLVGGTEEDVRSYDQKIKKEQLFNVRLLGHQPHRLIPVFLRAADLLILPNKKGAEISETYTSPLKLFEYMASGRPIIASDLPSIREVLNHRNAFFFKANDSLSLAGAVTTVMSDDILANTISGIARSDVEQYTWAKRAQRVTDFLEEILSR